MNWLKKLFAKTEGAFVDVNLDYEFRAVSAGVKGATTGPYPHTLHITDLSPALAEKALTGKRFDWQAIHSHWRHHLELGGFFAATWEEVQQYLKDWVE